MVLWRWKWFLNVWSAWLPMRMPFICNFHLNSLKPEIHLKLGKINLPIEKLKWSKNLNISWQYIKIDVVFAQFYISCGQWTSSFFFFGETVCSLQLFTQTCQFYAIAGRSQLGGKFTSTKFIFFSTWRRWLWSFFTCRLWRWRWVNWKLMRKFYVLNCFPYSKLPW